MGIVIYPGCWSQDLSTTLSWPAVEAPIQESHEHFQSLIRLERERSNKQHLEFRVRLEDEYGSALEFSAFGHRSLHQGCLRALNGWTGFLPRHAEVQARLQAFQTQLASLEASLGEGYRHRCWQLWRSAGVPEPQMAATWKQHVVSTTGQLDALERLRRELLLVAPQRLTLQMASPTAPHAWKTPQGYATPLILSVHDVRPSLQQVGTLHAWDLRLPGDEQDALTHWPALWMAIRDTLQLSST